MSSVHPRIVADYPVDLISLNESSWLKLESFYVVSFVSGNLTSLWKYFAEMYKLDAFVQSCPADQDIINHYKLQQGTKMTKREELETPSFTNTVPEAI